MDQNAALLGDAPGPAPRDISWRQLFESLPGNLVMMVIVYPILLPAATIWLLCDGGKESFTAFGTAVVLLPFYCWLIWRHSRQMQRFDSVQATLLKCERGKQEFSGCHELTYEYLYKGERFQDDHLSSRKPTLSPGDRFWILVDPHQPQTSLIWPRTEE